MRSFLGICVAASVLAAAPASAQPWKDAYETGDMFRALDMLQPLVFERHPMQHDDLDPMAPLYLATYYVNGWRVKKDPVVACGLVMSARRAAEMQRRYPEPLKLALEALEEKTCGIISQEQRMDAMLVGDCPNIGLAGQMVDLGEGSWVEMTQRKVVLDQPGRRSEADLAMPCAQQVLPARARRLLPPPGAVGHERQLVELFAWYAGLANGERRRQLLWTVWEVVDGGIEISAVEPVADEAGSTWPLRPVPDNVRFDFRFTRNGEVEYTLTDAAGKQRRGELRPYEEILKAVARRTR